MKIVTFADTHCGVKNYGKIDKTSGLNEREIQTIKLLNDVIDYSINNNADVLIFAGDMYKNNIPSPTIINNVNSSIIRASKAGIKTLILDGNHDVSRQETFDSGLKQFSTLKIDNIVQTRFFKEEIISCDGMKYKFAFLPTYHTKEEISDIIKNLDTSIPTIIIGHLSIRHAKLNDWNIIDKEECIDCETFNKDGIIAVVLGHLHKHQILNEKPLIYYTGSTNTIDFSEEKQDKGFVVLNVNKYDVKYTFIKLDSQKFLTLKISATGENIDVKELEDKIINALNEKDISNAIMRIQLEIDEEIILNEKRIIDFAYSKNVKYILKIQKIYKNKKVNNDSYIDNSLSVYDAIEKYYSGQKRSTERIKLGKEIIKMVEENN